MAGANGYQHNARANTTRRVKLHLITWFNPLTRI